MTAYSVDFIFGINLKDEKNKVCIPRYNEEQHREDRIGITALTKHLTATDRFGHTWTFNIPLLAVGLSGGHNAVNCPPTLSWHVEEGGEEGKQRKVIRTKGAGL